MNFVYNYNQEEILDLSSHSNISYFNYKSISKAIDNQNISAENIKALILPETCKSIRETRIKFIDIFPNVEEVIWPEINFIPTHFFGLSKIRRIHINKCKAINNFAFEDSDIEYFKCPDNLEALGVGAFIGAHALAEVDFCNLALSINTQCFYDCNNLTSIVNTDKIISIGEQAFSNVGISRLIISPSVEKIEGKAFCKCQQLESVKFEGQSCAIGDSIFNNCVNLANVDFNNISENVPDYMFAGCKSLSLIENVDKVIHIGSHSFMKTGLKNLDGFNNLSSFEDQAFSKSSLKTVTIPKKVKQIPVAAFQDCSMLERVNFESDECKEIATDAFFNSALIKIDLPTKLEVIGDYAFEATKIEEITIPNSVNQVGVAAFSSCVCLCRVYWSTSCLTIDCETFCGCANLQEILNAEQIENLIGSALNYTHAKVSCPNIKLLDLHEIDSFDGVVDLSFSAISKNDVIFDGQNVKGIKFPYFWY